MNKCVQCTMDNNNGEQVCNVCIEDAMRLVEGALGGRPTAAQIARMFDMGGGGCAPTRQIDQFIRHAKEQIDGNASKARDVSTLSIWSGDSSALLEGAYAGALPD